MIRCWRRLVPGIVGALFFVGIARADMVPLCRLGTERHQSLSVCSQAEVSHTNPSVSYDNPYDNLIVTDFNFSSIHFPLKITPAIGQPSQKTHSIDLTKRPASVRLCLYALMSLGLCSAPHWIKRFSFDIVPAWYHDGGPSQIGHSLAISPDSLHPIPVYCFFQPDDVAENAFTQNRFRTIRSLWRNSQFTPDVLGSRGPPLT